MIALTNRQSHSQEQDGSALPDRIRVLHVNLLPPGHGGIERLLEAFLHGMNNRHIETSLCVLSKPNDCVSRLIEEGYRIWTLGRREDRFDFGLFRRVHQLLKQEQPDVIHIHGTAPVLFTVPAARMLKLNRLIYTCHFSQRNRTGLEHLWFRTLLRLVPDIVGVSGAARDVLVDHYGVRPEKTRIIQNGVDEHRFAPGTNTKQSPDDCLTIGFCGVFRPEKQVPDLIEAFAAVHQQSQGIRLLLVGDGAERDRYEQLVDQLGLAESVTFAGQQNDVRPWLQQMDIVVLPSREEAMPVALLEAMALGRCCIGSSIPGIIEVLDDQQNGLLFRSGDAEELTHRIRQLLKDGQLRERLGRAARTRVLERFSERRMMHDYEQLYREQMIRFPAEA